MADKSRPFSFRYNTTKEKNLRKKSFKKITFLGKQENQVMILSYFVHDNFNDSLFGSIFPSELKRTDITPIYKKKSEFDIWSYHIIPLLSLSFSTKYTKSICLIKCLVTLIEFSRNINVDSGKVTAPNTTLFLS